MPDALDAKTFRILRVRSFCDEKGWLQAPRDARPPAAVLETCRVSRSAQPARARTNRARVRFCRPAAVGQSRRRSPRHRAAEFVSRPSFARQSRPANGGSVTFLASFVQIG